MTLSEFSNSFDTLVNSFNNSTTPVLPSSKSDVVFDEYEKSVFLTKAQEEIVVNLYNGHTSTGESFEMTEEMRRYLDSLVETKVYNSDDQLTDKIGLSDKSFFYLLPDNIAFITLEQVILNDDSLGCYNGSRVGVYPVTQDEFERVRNNPFRGPTKYKVLRIDYGSNIAELISKYTIDKYLIKYIIKPSPIILIDLPDNLTIDGISKATECQLNSILHNTILERAVVLALRSKGITIGK